MTRSSASAPGNDFAGELTGGSVLVHDDDESVERPGDEAEASRRRAARLKGLFGDIDPIEITGSVDLRGKSPQDIARMLPRFTTIRQEGGNPAFGILVDPLTGRAWSLRSGFSPDVVETIDGIPFRTGTMTREVAQAAGGAWAQQRVPLGAHVEGQAAAFMRRAGIAGAVLHINGSTPCKNGGIGCSFLLPELLAEGSTLTVFNKNGRAFSPFVGLPD